MRAGTRTQHETAETQGFITRLMKGELNRAAYADFLAQHHAIYVALEETGFALRAAGADDGIVLDELIRVPSLEADLEFLFGADWRTEIEILPATQAYAARLRELDSWLGGWVAHAYTRYLGDLSGGQVIRTMLQRHYGFESEGVTFYHFAEIAKPKVFKDVYRERLDALPFGEDELDRVVAEAQHAFELNTALFRELGDRHPA
ncbi:MAG: biliverdin-producing heme oxygenase [Actinomycetales bacterium]|nr:biliverdin-producing heme oxygenase [Actinomycetales bacterium]